MIDVFSNGFVGPVGLIGGDLFVVVVVVRLGEPVEISSGTYQGFLVVVLLVVEPLLVTTFTGILYVLGLYGLYLRVVLETDEGDVDDEPEPIKLPEPGMYGSYFVPKHVPKSLVKYT